MTRRAPKSLRVFFLRHGEAGKKAAWAGDDAERPLTKEGRQQVRRVAEAIARMGVEPDLIFTSPYVRAAETAQIVATVLGLTDRVMVEPALAPGGGATQLPPALGANPGLSVAMLVGHEPDLSSLVASISGGSQIALKKAGIAEVRFEKGAGSTGVVVPLAQPGP